MKPTDYKQRSFSNRDLALVAGLSALYLAYGYVSGVTLLTRAVRELDLFFLIAALFTILVSLTGKQWTATILGTVTGVLLLGERAAGQPAFISLSLIADGLVFSATLRALKGLSSRPPRSFILAGVLGNLVLSITGLAISGAQGYLSANTLAIVLAVAFIGSPIVGALGAMLGIIVIRRMGDRVRLPITR
jgi:hypothetical protein